jgi:2-iminobutanoate/2-iminopropanoate deaminase
MRVVSTPDAPAAIGPYSQGIEAGSFVFTSGQLPLDPASGLMPSGPTAQAEQSLKNLKALLEAGGSSLEKVVKVTIFLQDLEHFAAVNEVYSKFFPGPLPARSCVQVARLPKDALLEIEAIGIQ